MVRVTGISGGEVGDTPPGSLGGGTLSGTGEGTSIGSGCGGISGGSGGMVGPGAGSGTRGSDIMECVLLVRGYFGSSRRSPPGEPGAGMTGVLPVSGGSMVLSGLRSLGGGITPSHRRRRSLKEPPGHVDPVEPGSCGGDLSGRGSLGLGGVDVWASDGVRLHGPIRRPRIRRWESLLMHCASGSVG